MHPHPPAVAAEPAKGEGGRQEASLTALAALCEEQALRYQLQADSRNINSWKRLVVSPIKIS